MRDGGRAGGTATDRGMNCYEMCRSSERASAPSVRPRPPLPSVRPGATAAWAFTMKDLSRRNIFATQRHKQKLDATLDRAVPRRLASKRLKVAWLGKRQRGCVASSDRPPSHKPMYKVSVLSVQRVPSFLPSPSPFLEPCSRIGRVVSRWRRRRRHRAVVQPPSQPG